MKSKLSRCKAALDQVTGIDWEVDEKAGRFLSPPQRHNSESIVASARAVICANEMLAFERPSGREKQRLYPFSFHHTSQDTPAHAFQISFPVEAVAPLLQAHATNANARRKIEEIRSCLAGSQRMSPSWGSDIARKRKSPSATKHL